MKTRVGNVREPPVLWSIPFTLLMLMLVVAAAEVLFPFIPLNIDQHIWLWVVSTLITTIIASLITEKLSMNNKRALISMGLAAVVSSLIYNDLSKLIQRSIVGAVQGYIPNPLLGTAVYTSFLAVVPGALTGVILGGILGSFPIGLTLKQRQRSLPTSESVENHRINYEKFCNRCGHQAPFESEFCPFCGTELTSRQAPSINFCRFCGSRIYHLGMFCPECGREIDMMSKPQIYISK